MMHLKISFYRSIQFCILNKKYSCYKIYYFIITNESKVKLLPQQLWMKGTCIGQGENGWNARK